MSDPIVAKGSESKYKAHPIGQFIGSCVDTIDLGEKVQDFPGTTPYLAQTCAVVFRTGERNEETGDYIDIAREFTVSMGEKANLRKFLEQWRGQAYTADELKAGVPLHKLTGQPALLSISHKTSSKDRVYANITACVGVPKQMKDGIGKYTDYVRDAYWETKKKQYAEAAAAFRGDTGTATHGDEDYAPLDEPTDDLPF